MPKREQEEDQRPGRGTVAAAKGKLRREQGERCFGASQPTDRQRGPLLLLLAQHPSQVGTVGIGKHLKQPEQWKALGQGRHPAARLTPPALQASVPGAKPPRTVS